MHALALFIIFWVFVDLLFNDGEVCIAICERVFSVILIGIFILSLFV